MLNLGHAGQSGEKTVLCGLGNVVPQRPFPRFFAQGIVNPLPGIGNPRHDTSIKVVLVNIGLGFRETHNLPHHPNDVFAQSTDRIHNSSSLISD